MEDKGVEENFIDNHIAIGELSALTGISTHALRVWERRYGSPRSMRLPSGHRRYPREEVPRLRAVARALKAGLRPKKVVPASLEDLEKLLQIAPLLSQEKKGVKGQNPTTEEFAHSEIIENWIEGVHRYCNQTLNQGFHEEWSKRGPMNFVHDCAAVFVHRVGKGWEKGELSVSQEHFASARLSDFLGSMWRRLSERNDGEVCVLAGLPGEPHSLGLSMAAVITAVTGRRIIYLGADTPPEDIIASTKACGGKMVCVSVSETYDPNKAGQFLQKIRKALDPSIRMVVGGKGAPGGISGIAVLASMNGYFQWLQNSKDS